MSQQQNKFTVLIADDESHARERLNKLLLQLNKDFPIGEILQATNGLEAFQLIDEADDNSKPAIVFLDIGMPEMNGLELAHHISKMRKPPLIVFVTSHSEHAVDAFDAKALDYILKPARVERVKEVFEKIDQIALTKEKFSNDDLAAAGLKTRTHLSVSERGKVRLIPIDDILYFKAELKYTTIKTIDKEFLTEEPLIGLENEFGDKFLRIHRNCLIPMIKLKGFERNKADESGWCAIIDGCQERLPVSRRQWAEIREKNLF